MNELIKSLKDRRSKLAAEIIEIRKIVSDCTSMVEKNKVKPGFKRNMIKKLIGDRISRQPLKPTKKNLYRAAMSELKFSKSKWHNMYDTEYYSA